MLLRNYTKDDQATAEDFNKYFINVGKSTVKKINDLAVELNYDQTRAHDMFVPKT